MARRKRTKKKKRKRRARSIGAYYDYNRQEPHFLGRDYSKFSVIYQMNQQRQELEANESLKRWIGREKQFYNLVKQQSSLQDQPISEKDLLRIAQGYGLSSTPQKTKKKEDESPQDEESPQEIEARLNALRYTESPASSAGFSVTRVGDGTFVGTPRTLNFEPEPEPEPQSKRFNPLNKGLSPGSFFKGFLKSTSP